MRLLVAGLVTAIVAGLWLALAGVAGAATAADLDQCRNGAPGSPAACTDSAWQNGNLGANNSHYREGDSVPFRIVITDISTTGTHTLDIEYDTTAGGAHAYDYLTSYDRTETSADPCSGVAGCVLGSPTSTGTIPTDPTLADASPEVAQVPGAISAWGAVISDVEYLVLPPGPEGAHNQTQVRITFTASSSTVVFAWGGHIATQADWGAGDAASSVPGSPYHMRLEALDGAGGNQDRSLAANAILAGPSIATSVTPGAISLGASVTDTAVLSGPSGAVEGSVAFSVCGPGASPPPCAAAGSGTRVGGPVDVVAGQATSAPFTPEVAGTYCFRADYTPASGAPYSPARHTNLTNECFSVVAEVSVAVVKVAEDPAIFAGQPAAFAIVVANTGTGTATGVTLTDRLPAGVNWGLSPAVAGCRIDDGVLSCALGGLVPGESVTIRVTGATAAPACGVLSNTAAVRAANETPGLGTDNSSSASIAVGCPDVTVRKAAANGTISAGEAAEFEVVVSNGGAGTATGVILSDQLPAGVDWSVSPAVRGCDIVGGRLECALGSLARGQSVTVNLTGTTDAPDCGLLTNTASVGAANEPAAATRNNSAAATIAVNCAAIGLAKVADADVVSAGDAIGFTLTASNPGPGDATGVSITDVLPAAPGTVWTIDGGTGQALCRIVDGTLTCDLGVLAGGASRSVHLSSPTTEASCATLDNVAALATANSGSAQAADQVAVECARLQVEKAADAAAVPVGDPIGYTVRVRNTGAGLARGVTLTDALPAGPGIAWAMAPEVAGCLIRAGTLNCGFGDLAPGERRSVHVASSSSAASCATYANTARASAGAVTVEATAATAVICGRNPDAIVTPLTELRRPPAVAGDPRPLAGQRTRLVVRKAGPARARGGTAAVYVIRVTNRGRATAEDVVIRDRLPGGLVLPRRPHGVVFRSGELTWRLGDLRAGASRTVRVRVQVLAETTGRRCNLVRASAANARTVRDGACTRIVRQTVPLAGRRPAVTG